MNIIVLNSKRGHSRTLSLPRHWPWMLGALLIVMPIMLGFGAYWLAARSDMHAYGPVVTERFAKELGQQRQQLTSLNRESEEQFRAFTVQLANAQARLVRLDALGERLVEVADISSDEFDFSTGLALGGPEIIEGNDSFAPPSFMQALDQLTETLERRERQLDIMNSLLANRDLQNQTYLAGRPVARGWMSSRFGRRTDPFSGSISWHRGVDFAAPTGTPIMATGAGVVTHSGDRGPFGLTVEVSHGDGLVTRYAHASELLVEVGDIVRSGDLIAKVGSTGRSTGPHLHYEVLKSGRQVNPQPYIQRASR